MRRYCFAALLLLSVAAQAEEWWQKKDRLHDACVRLDRKKREARREYDACVARYAPGTPEWFTVDSIGCRAEYVLVLAVTDEAKACWDTYAKMTAPTDG